MKQIQARKGWTTSFENLDQKIQDLEVLYEFYGAGEVTEEELFPRLQAEAAKEPQPDLHIRGDKAVRYEKVATAMAAAQRAGVRKIGFVTDPQQ